MTGENTPFAWSEISDFEVTDAHPDEAFDFVAELIEHEANLTFDSLIECESKMFWAKNFHAFGFGAATNDMAEYVRSTPWMHNLSWPAALIVSGFLFYQSLSWDIGWFWKLCVIAIGGYFTYALFVAALFIAAGVLIIWLVSKTGAF